MNARRSGIIIRIPSDPPSTETAITVQRFMSKPTSITAGMAMPTPKAIDSPAEPVVCTMLFSRIVARRKPNIREKRRKRVIESTATGNRGRDGHAHLQHQVQRRGPEDDPQHGPHDHGRESELGLHDLVGHIGLVTSRRRPLRTGWTAGQPTLPSSRFSRC